MRAVASASGAIFVATSTSLLIRTSFKSCKAAAAAAGDIPDRGPVHRVHPTGRSAHGTGLKATEVSLSTKVEMFRSTPGVLDRVTGIAADLPLTEICLR